MSNNYQDKVNRFITTVEHNEPDRVPILSMFGTWAVSYANSSIETMEKDPEKEIDIYCAPHKEVYSDATYTCGLAFDSLSAKIIGSESHFTSEDGQTVQHKEMVPMEADEYDQLAKDPMGFMFNVMLPRKAKRLAQPYPENYKAIKELLEHWKVKSAVQAQLAQRLKEEFELPVLTGSFAYPAMDIIFDYLRGFKGISIDLRRNPEQLLAGINALDGYANELMGITPGMTSVPSFPFYATMMHLPTFINPKQFGKFFWPTYEKMLLRIHELGGKIIIFLEGKWEPKYEFLNNLPKDFVVGVLEEDDIFEAKKKIGDNITLAGGMPLHLLKYGTKDECVDYAKKLIDTCAPGGGYIFTSSRELLSKGDLNVENLIAVNNYVHENAVY